ncbi:MAG: outer membrane lipoprotein carrier protein LolA [Verrucomicrobiales bacterium]|nr:outer membrane lipoprotein carrier protein LolA [Verrucomicrobiales bacterium]
MAITVSRRKAGLLIGAVVLGAVAADEPSPTRDAASVTRNDISQAMAGARTIFCRFVQDRHLALFQEPLRSEGYLCFLRPGRVRWETTIPYRSILVSDGNGVAQFEWSDDRWKKLDLGLSIALEQVLSQIAGVMEGNFASDRRGYSATVTSEADGPKIVLIPQNEKIRKMMASIEVHVSADMKGTRRVVLRETGGDYTEIRFEDQVINGILPERTFDLRNPIDIASIRDAVTAPNSSTRP